MEVDGTSRCKTNVNKFSASWRVHLGGLRSRSKTSRPRSVQGGGAKLGFNEGDCRGLKPASDGLATKWTWSDGCEIVASIEG